MLFRSKTTSGASPRDLKALFDELRKVVEAQAPPGQQGRAVQQVKELEAEAAKGKQPDDSRLAKLIEGLVGLVPGAVSAIASAFATPVLGSIAGPVTKFVLDKLKPD